MNQKSHYQEILGESDMLLRLIAEDIKLNYLHFGLKDLGIECGIDILAIGEIVFDLLHTNETTKEAYYQRINALRGLTGEEMQDQLYDLSRTIFVDVLSPKVHVA